ncbi:TetR/AcrR family transcriptional regulator [Oxalobacteraceae bacterium OTU3CINTB1]|nr:TetR/AcrR family transcriptional regulator [Oxalobacteraceae bacterium OTU3CINTB1]
MTAPTAGKRGKAPKDSDLLAAACGIVAQDGWAGLALRPLAERLNVSVTVLSNHYGTRADVVAAVCRTAHAKEQGVFAGWRATLAKLDTLSPALAADLADTILQELAVRHRDFSLLFLEILQSGGWDEPLRAAFLPWLDERMGFWAQLGARAGLSTALTDSGWLGGYFVDELAFSISLDQQPAYRMLRRLCLRRLFSGVSASAATIAEDDAIFAALFDELDYREGEVAVGHGVDVPADWPGKAARACAIALTERGVGALTHRAIAAEAGVPHTTLIYRFATQQDLVVAGLEFIISHVLRAVDEGALSGDLTAAPDRMNNLGDHGLDVGRATFALAIAAARMPRLAPSAADMRRRRGINLVKILRRVSPTLPGIDMLAAQIASVGLIGYTCTLPLAQKDGFVPVYRRLLGYLGDR